MVSEDDASKADKNVGFAQDVKDAEAASKPPPNENRPLLPSKSAKMLGMPEGRVMGKMHWVAKSWLIGRLFLVLALAALPAYLYRNSLEQLWPMWYTPLLGIVAGAIPSGGAPVAGGIIYMPILMLSGVCPRDAVAFTSVAQFAACGIFIPLNWLVLDPNSFIWPALQLGLVPAVVGMLLALLVIKIESDSVLLLIFSLFCFAMACYVAHGLFANHLNTDLKQKPLPFTTVDYVLYVVGLFLSGMLTGYIGISVEKVLFWLLTWRQKASVEASCVTSITLIGFLSGIAMVVHIFSPCDLADPSYTGAIPWRYVLMGMPGILLGTIVGPQLNAWIGPRNIMIAFCFMLLFDAAKNAYSVAGAWNIIPMGATYLCFPVDCVADAMQLQATNGWIGLGRLGGPMGPKTLLDQTSPTVA